MLMIIFMKELLKELNSEIRIRLSLDFRQLLRALFMSPLDFDTHCLKMCVKGLGTNEKVSCVLHTLFIIF